MRWLHGHGVSRGSRLFYPQLYFAWQDMQLVVMIAKKNMYQPEQGVKNCLLVWKSGLASKNMLVYKCTSICIQIEVDVG